MKKKIIILSGLVIATLSLTINARGIESYGLGFIAPQISGRANVANPTTGEIIFDSTDGTDGSFYGRFASGWQKLSNEGTVGNPAGTILAFAAESVPTGYLPCDGRSVLKEDYQTLYDVIGDSYGSADSAHFNLPDLRGRFIRGWDNSAGNDPDAGLRNYSAPGGVTGDNVGSLQVDMVRSHSHTAVDNGHTHATLESGAYAAANSRGTTARAGGASYEFATSSAASYTNTSYGAADITVSYYGGNETRPKNVYVQYIIKY